MTVILSTRVNKIKPSPTLAVTAKTAELKSQGKDIISLGAGEPDFDTPANIKVKANEAIASGHTRYTPVGGIIELKQAICNKLKQDNDLKYNPEEILVSTGAKQSIYNAMQALLDEGDEVLIPAPYWVSYPDMSILAGAKPVFIATGIKQNFKISAEQLEQAITPKSKLLILNSPANPTGVAYTKEELAAIADVLIKHPRIVILSDDIYEHILWHEEPFANIAMAAPELKDRTIVVNGVSKAYAMTGWRIGYAATSVKVIKAMSKIQGQSTSNPCSISQYAALEAISGDQSCIKDMLQAFKRRHDYIVTALNTIDGINCIPSDGTFYSFFNVEKLIQRLPKINNDVELATLLLEDANIALVPGSAFGAPGYLRLSFATSDANLEQAIERLKKCVK